MAGVLWDGPYCRDFSRLRSAGWKEMSPPGYILEQLLVRGSCVLAVGAPSAPEIRIQLTISHHRRQPLTERIMRSLGRF